KRARMSARRRPSGAHARPLQPEIDALLMSRRITAALLLLLGVVPTANFVTTGAGLPWWSTAVEQWALFTVVTLTIALLAGFLAAPRVEQLASAATRLISRPSPIA